MIRTLFYNPTGFFTLLNREISRFMKVYIQTLMAPLLSNLLFLGVFGGMLKTREVGIEGIGYLQFLVPGLAAMGAIFAAFQNPSFSIIAQKYQDTLRDINSYPLTTFEKVLAFVLGGTFRGFLIGTLTYIATIWFVGYRIENPTVFFIMLALISFIFSSLGVIAGLFLENFERMNFILAIILTPMAYFGGVFFEISKLPDFLSGAGYLNPLFPMINLLRYGYLGVYEGNLLIQLIFVPFVAVAAFGTAYYFFNKGVGLKD
ncbi:MAG: ABC transporter permease [Desulfobacterales bacterium]|nr:ABC transporter permease [Desulfobacterales bacterium]MCP4159060.1 ABC transporter permease [Deltaproteobacteria bacterium]